MNASRSGLLGLAIVIALITLPSTSFGASAASTDFAPRTADGQIPILVFGPSLDEAVRRIEEAGGAVTYRYQNLTALAATIPEERLADVRAIPGIRYASRQTLVRPAVVAPTLPPGAEALDLRIPLGDPIVTLDSPALRSRSRKPGPADHSGLGTAKRNFMGYNEMTGASQVWEETDYGAGTIVAIIDTGIYPLHPMLEGNVIGGFNLVPAEEEQAQDYNGDNVPDGLSFDWDAVQNGDHGTFVAGMVAGHVELIVPEDDILAQSLAIHSPGTVEFPGDGTAVITLMGTAPGASLYAVKVFPYAGGGSPDARVAAAIDQLISMKKAGELDVDVINMSLSGPVLWDGGNPLDLMVDAATAAGITVVSAAANDGPSLTSIGSPGSALTGLTAGAVIDPLHTRIAIDVLTGTVGFGQLVYPHEEMFVADFSSRGLTADGRVKPDLVAAGFLVFSSALGDFDQDGLRDTPTYGFSAGTSFATPTIAGAAALVTAYGNLNGLPNEAPYVARALRRGAVPIAPPESFSMRDQGRGFVNLPNSIGALGGGAGAPSDLGSRRHLLQRRVSMTNGTLSFETPDLPPGQSFDFLVDIPEYLEGVEFTATDVVLGESQNPLLGDALQVFIHSAKRGGSGDYHFADAVAPGDSYVYTFPEPGTARITVLAPFSNYSPARLRFRLSRQRLALTADVSEEGTIAFGGFAFHEVEVPAGLEALAVRLSWDHDWTQFPTYDLDLSAQDPEGGLHLASTLDSPELLWIEAPPAGTWTFAIADYFSVQGSEPYLLELAFIEGETLEPALVAFSPHVSASLTSSGESGSLLRLQLPVAGPVEVDLFDVSGRRVEGLLDRDLTAGDHELAVTTPKVSDGIYFLRVRTEAGASVQKVLLR